MIGKVNLKEKGEKDYIKFEETHKYHDNKNDIMHYVNNETQNTL